MFYKLEALQQENVKIHLHCFRYGRDEQRILNNYCESVDYYSRNTGMNELSFTYPYIVKSRRSEALLRRLLLDDYPILMEGIHCTYLLSDSRFKHRRCLVRLHNIESIYYRHLFHSSGYQLKKLYYFWESLLLKKYETKIASKATYLSVTQKDADTFCSTAKADVQFLPLFLPGWKVCATEGKGTFCLYQGDLSVVENEKAVLWLLQEVFNDLAIPFVIAGKNPSKQLVRLVESKQTACLIANPGENEMQDLIIKSHINIIPSYNSTGIKLKLLNALYHGKHCIVNDATVLGTGLEKACHIANDAKTFKAMITRIYDLGFNSDNVSERHHILDNLFDNKKNALQLINTIWRD